MRGTNRMCKHSDGKSWRAVYNWYIIGWKEKCMVDSKKLSQTLQKSTKFRRCEQIYEQKNQ